MEFVLDLVLLFIAWAHVFISPYTKVEESFNLHATHDVFFYGVTKDGLKKYDHFIFPGAVPRSFLGSLWLGWTTRILATLLVPLGLIRTKFHVQIALRLVLTTANALALRRVRAAVSGRFGRITGIMFGLLTCSQFHMPFWMGRTLPNSFALVLFNEALSRTTWQPQALAPVIGLLCFSAVVFRAELAAYLGIFCIFILIRHRSWLVRLLLIGAVCTALSLTCTVVVDSYFWQDWPMWPEWRATYFNVVQGKSAEWGVSPFHVYWTQHLPKLLLGAFPLSLLGLVINRKARRLAIPAIAFVCVMSVLAHKEWRFVLYTVPIFNIAAACALTDLWTRGTLTRLVALGILGANLVAMAGFTYVSSTNYPGGEALSVANRLNVSNANLHICNLAAQTGASLFLQEHSPPHLYKSQPGTKSWTYDKTEGLVILHPYTHAIVEELAVVEGWHVNATIEAYSGITKRGVRYTPSLWIVSNPHA